MDQAIELAAEAAIVADTLASTSGGTYEHERFDPVAFRRALAEAGFVVIRDEQSNLDALSLSTYIRDQIERLGGALNYNEDGLLARRVYGRISGKPWGAP